MLGHTHALSGACAGLAAGTALGMSIPSTAVLAGFTAAFAVMPDMDKCGSGPARSLGPLSELLAWIVGKLSGGHRHFTHCLAGIAVFTGLAWLACAFRHDLAGKAGLMLLLSLAFSAGLRALRLGHGLTADILGTAAAAAVTFAGTGLALVPLACLTGWSTHIAGDMLTDSGCMLAYPASKYRFHLLPEPLAFTTGTRPETLIVDPLLLGALAALATLAADPSLAAAAWHAAHL
jgi:membrane-bound metal-dependent hydrolase YbcI (DUF457 family)